MRRALYNMQIDNLPKSNVYLIPYFNVNFNSNKKPETLAMCQDKYYNGRKF